MEQRAKFSSRIGFVLAAAGSAVGLGNIWRFPYLAAKYGGGMFLLIYILLVVTFGFVLMVTEIGLGRKTGLSVIGAYKKLNDKWAFVGVLSALIPIIIVSYYCVIGGWVAKYFADFISGMGAAAAEDTYFSGFIGSDAAPFLWLAVYVAANAAVILMGVKKGIEKVSRVLMPLLIGLSVAVAVYCMTLPGASEGVAYYLLPDPSRFSMQALLAAMGQMFFSLSLAMGIMVTYGSYMKKGEDIEKSVKQIEWFDAGVALLAGLMIVPAVFVFSGGDAGALSAGPALMFVTMPKVFASMGFAGNVIGTMFFLLVLFAALTSSVSLMETAVSVFRDRFHFSRKKAILTTVVIILAVGGACSMAYGSWDFLSVGGMSLLDVLDFASNSIMMPVAALLTCIFVGFVLKPDVIVGEVKLSSKFKRERMYRVFIKYIAPVLVCAVLVSAVLDGLGVVKL